MEEGKYSQRKPSSPQVDRAKKDPSEDKDGQTKLELHVERKEETGKQKDENPEIKMKMTIARMLKIIYILITVIVIFSAVVLIGLSAVGAIVFRSYSIDSDDSRVAAMIVVATLAAVGVTLGAYGIATTIRNKKKPLNMISMAFAFTACLLLAVALVMVHMSTANEAEAATALMDSFRQTRRNGRYEKQWHQTQFGLDCCGVNGPDDYGRGGNYFSLPEVATSCCSGYDPTLSDLAQSDMLLACRQQRTYYRSGCGPAIVQVLSDSASVVYVLSIVLVACFFLEAALGVGMAKLVAKKKHVESKNTVEPAPTRA